MTVITFTKPIAEFNTFFANGEDVSKAVDLYTCTDFWAKGTNSETLIYSGRKIVYSCCYSSFYDKLFITSVWSENGCEYEYKINYDDLEKQHKKRI